MLLNLNENISEKADSLLLQYCLSHGLLIADALIVATAITWNYPLISKNQRDYHFITVALSINELTSASSGRS